MIAIIDYGMGNVGSVKNALAFLGAEATVTADAAEIGRASHIILPGVGAFGDGMRALLDAGLVEIIRRHAVEFKKPFLGICLGMQLLATEGEEGGCCAGLNLIPGRVRHFQVDEEAYRVPHMGWNDVSIHPGARLFDGIDPLVFYFVHSYVFVPSDPSVIAATCEYGEPFAASLQADNLYGTQFHPEKSQASGLALLGRFLHA